MCNIRHILRLHTQNQTQSEIIVQTGIPRKILKKYIEIFKASKLSFDELNELNDKDLEELFLIPQEFVNEKMQTLLKYFPTVDRELRRKGVTIQLLWEEYIKKYPDGVSQSHFKRHLFRWKSRISPVMRREHKAGDKLYIDFAGEKLIIIDKETGEARPVEVFVAILGASQLTYVQAVMSQQKEDFIPACEDALQYFGGVPAAIVPDNLRSAVTKSHKYEPTINETFSDFAEHYNTTILPARVYRPTDKALVEIAINIIYTRIYAKIREIKFFSLNDLNSAILLALDDHNNQLLTGRDYSRRQKFEVIERKTLIPLPPLRYEFKKQQYSTVSTNGHVALTADKHYYSVPFGFIGKKVKVMYTRYNVEVFYNYERIALHKRLKSAYSYTTDKEHLDPKYRFVSEVSPERFISLAEEIHKDVKLYIIKILNKNHHPEKSYRICTGVLSFAKKVGNERLIKACQRAHSYGCYDFNTIQKILEKGLDKFEEEDNEEKQMPAHDNIRGGDYYK
jgi:transposase